MKKFFSTFSFIVVLAVLGFAAYAALPQRSEAEVLNASQANASDFSNVAGAAPAAGGKYNTLALVLDNGISTASQLLANVNSTTGTTAVQVLQWNPNTGFETYDPNDPFSVDFSLSVGDPVFVLLEGASTSVYSIVGDVPAQGSVQFNLVGSGGSCTYNFISIPLDTDAGITTASQLATDIGNVSQVLNYDPNSGFITYDANDPFSTDFSVQRGYPYFVCMTASKTWPS